MEEQPILAPEHSRLIWWASWLSLAAGLYAVNQGHLHLAIAPLSVWLTSLLYWWHPTKGWRRDLDMMVVKAALLLHLWYAGWRLTYATITAIGIGFYYISWNVYDNGLHLDSAIYQCGVHVLANIANFYLNLSEG
jgi:hypothetical protein